MMMISSVDISSEGRACLKGYVSPNSERREPMLERKRSEYHNFVEQYYSTRHQDIHRDTYRQVLYFAILLTYQLSPKLFLWKTVVDEA